MQAKTDSVICRLINLFINLFVRRPGVICSGNGLCPVDSDRTFVQSQDYDEQILSGKCKNLLALTEQLKEWEINLMVTERELKRLYPERTDAILRRYSQPDLPRIYVITPTYTRPVQKAELTRLINTFLHVKALHWIVIEDADSRSVLVENLLRHSGIPHTHLFVKTPPHFKLNFSVDPSWQKPRGIEQRNAALQWIRNNLLPDVHKGVVYFADDDNTYDLQLFEEVYKIF